jgi:hypothetical protein
MDPAVADNQPRPNQHDTKEDGNGGENCERAKVPCRFLGFGQHHVPELGQAEARRQQSDRTRV